MDVGLGYPDADFHGIELNDFKDRLSRSGQLAGLNRSPGDIASQRRAERRVRKTFPGQLFRG